MAAQGSSSNSNGACPTKARANRARCCWPPDSWSRRRWARSCRPTRCRAPSTWQQGASERSAPLPAIRPRATSARTVIGKCQAISLRWGIRASRPGRFKADPWGSPSIKIRPSATGSWPAMACSRLLLPAPLGPTRAVRLPAASANVRCSNTGRWSRRTVRSATSRAGAGYRLTLLLPPT